jgi:hypothetical protein
LIGCAILFLLLRTFPGIFDHHDKTSSRAARDNSFDGDAIRKLGITCTGSSDRCGAGAG